MPYLIAITGTPASGKTELSKELSLLLGAKVIHLSSFIKEASLSEGFDKERDCEIVDPVRLAKAIIPRLEKARSLSRSVIVEGHLSHCLPSRLFSVCIVTHADQKVLTTRLKSRGYSTQKVQENLDCENLDVCGTEAREAGYFVLEADTTKVSPKILAKELYRKILRR